MDLEVESSNTKQELLDKDREDGNSGKLGSSDGIQVEMNGEVGDEMPSDFSPSSEAERQVEDTTLVDATVSSPLMPVRSDDGGAGQEAESPQNLVGSPSPGIAVQTPGSSSNKGYGLKKWRRIRRNLNKDAASEADSAIIHKRRLPIHEDTKGRDERIRSYGEDEAEESAASVASRTIIGPSVSIAPSPPVALDLELRSLAESCFSVGTESDNSDERNSKSSTAASALRLRHEIGFGRERSRMRNISSRGSGHVVHHKGQHTKGADSSRKSRGDRVRIEKENSYSSIESDMRSSNAAFMGWGSVASNGKKTTKSTGDEGEHSDDANQSEEVRSGYCKENGEFEDVSTEDLGADSHNEGNVNKNENNQSKAYDDPFLESIASLQAAQAALEDEIQKFGEIGKDVDFEDSDGEYEGVKYSALKAQLVGLNQQKERLECKLDEALATIKAKEARVLKLEAVLNRTESSNNFSFLEGKCKELEVEIENLLERKMEAEIEYLVLTRTTKSWNFVVEDHIALLEEQKALAGNQTNMWVKLRLAEDRAIKLKFQADELNAYCNELEKTQEALKLQNRVCKYSICCLVQTTMLCIALVLFLLQIFPSSSDVVPT